MFSKEERRALNTAFWNDFKIAGRKYKGADGRKKNWANYPTNVKQIYVRLHADTKLARFAIELQDKDEAIRQLIWEQFTELKMVLENEMEEPGLWEEYALNTANQEISRISWTLEKVNIYNQNDHEKIHRFLLKYARRFDRFYSTYNEILYALLK